MLCVRRRAGAACELLSACSAPHLPSPKVVIQKDCEVRLRVVGTRHDANEIFCVGTIKGNYLGLLAPA